MLSTNTAANIIPPPVLGIEVLDHIVVGDGECVSLRQRGLL